ncbi:unnamed protein product [Leptidea sinapis]|uniref:Uncharacterized protein n=1 Tax=Leptidea sinapis TaxID=189913 RepID=A0A5E4PX60_9NEOP|nr:unnamed protein product [Leptidea sinapis]
MICLIIITIGLDVVYHHVGIFHLIYLLQPSWQGHSLPPSNMLPLSESPILEITEQMESI